MDSDTNFQVRQRLATRRKIHLEALRAEAHRLAKAAADIGARRVILFGSLVKGNAGLASDLDLLIVLDSPLGFLERTALVYRQLQPQVGTDMLIYTTEEMKKMSDNSLIKRALSEGQVLYEA